MNREEFNRKRKKVPRGTYILMTLMGVYMVYIISRISEGLTEPDVSGRFLIYIAMVLIAACGIFFITFGIRSLVKREYAEAQEEDEPVTFEEMIEGTENESSKKEDEKEIR